MRNFITLALLSFCSISNAASATLLDQAQDSNLGGSKWLGLRGIEHGQTFTVGLSGQLSRIDIRVMAIDSRPNENILLTVYNTTTGSIDDLGLYTVSLTPDAFPIDPDPGYNLFPEWIPFDLSGFNHQVNAGDVLAFGLTWAGYELNGWAYYHLNVGVTPEGEPTSYLDGEYYVRALPDTHYYQYYPEWTEKERQDIVFRTYVTNIPTVDIDVDPWSAANIVKPDSNDSIVVAVMGSNTATGDATDFDVTQVDPDSLKLGVGEAPNIAVSSFYVDFDNDTNTDAAFTFKTQGTGIFCDDPDVTLQGETFSGEPFEGTDTIVTTDCATASCHP